MSMINAADQEYLKGLFAERLTGPVTLELYTRPRPRLHVPGQNDCQYCEETKQLLEDVAALSEQVTLVVHDILEEPDALADAGLREIPAIVFKGANKGTMRFFGIPAGNEFRNLVDGIIEVGNGDSGLSAETRQALADLEEDVHLRVFVTPT